ncbi:MAG: DUF4173 domain-containing protein [Planctomycetota bacterium]
MTSTPEKNNPANQVLVTPETFIPQIPNLTIMAILLLVFLFDYFIYQSWGRTDGLGLGTLILLTALVIRLVPPKAGLTERTFTGPSFLICTGLVIMLAIRSIWQSSAFNWLAGFVLLFVFTCSVKKYSVHIMELTHSFCLTVIRFPLALIGIVKTLWPLGAKLPAWSVKGFRLGLIWLIPAIVVLVFLLIFAAGNLVVESWMTKAWRWLWEQLIHIFDYFPSIGHIFFWIFAFFFAVILLAPKSVRRTILTLFLGEEEKMTKPSWFFPAVDLQATIARNTLVAVNLLFLFYNMVDIYFLRIKKILPEGLSYSTYARSGTFWLTLALALTSLILGIIFLRDLNFNRRTPILKILTWVWVGQNLIITLLTFQRLKLYIDYNGLTRLRIVGAYGITAVILGLLIVAFKIYKIKTFFWMTRRHLLVFALGLLALVITPMDWVVFKYNTRIILHDNPRPAIILAVKPITAEGIPALIPLLDCPDRIISEGVAGLLLREQEQLEKLKSKEKRWVDTELSRSYALKTIKSVQPRLKQIIPDGDWKKAVDKLYEYSKEWY